MSGAVTPPPAPPPGIGGGPAPTSAARKIGIIVGAVVVIGALYWLGSGPATRSTADDVGASQGGAGNTRRVSLPPPEPKEDPQPVQNPLLAALNTNQPRERPRQAPPKTKAAPIMAFEDRATDGGQATAAGAVGGAGDDPDDELAGRLRATRTETVKAKRLRDRELTLTAGTMIPCIRRTPVNTQLPGMVLCVTSDAVASQSGNVDLLPAHTKLVGQIQRSMMQGTDRAFILWTRAETPEGVTVELASPGTDAMGTNGIPVDVHTNFWARFGGAIMLSFLDAGLQAAAIGASTALQPGGNGQRLNFYQLQSGGRGAAARALDATVNIPPFGTAPEGEPEAVFVARDIDFTGVYRLRRTSR